MNLEQAKLLKTGDKVHHTANQTCTRTVGPRGKVKIKAIECRVSGPPITWKRSPERVQVPIKYGMYINSYITEETLNDWHLESECPLNFHPRDDVDPGELWIRAWTMHPPEEEV